MLGVLFLIVRKGSLTILDQRKQLQGSVTQAHQLAAQNAELRILADEARVEANERNEELIARVGSDLHDGPIQLLSSLILRLSAPSESPPGPVGPNPAFDSKRRATPLDLATNILTELRQLSAGLSLPEIEPMSLEEALRLVVSRHESVTGGKVRLEIGALPANLPLGVKICTYRVVQEALTNSYRHAGALHPLVAVGAGERTLRIAIEDDGQGKADALPGESNSTESGLSNTKLGIAGIRNRVRANRGSLDIAATASGGMRIMVALPI